MLPARSSSAAASPMCTPAWATLRDRRRDRPMIEPAAVQDLVARWWWNYDEGNFDVLTSLLTDDVHFSCRTDSGTTDYEEFVRADYTGRDAVMAWQTDHRRNSPYPLRHNGTNVHIVEQGDDEASFSSYIYVSQIASVGCRPSPPPWSTV